MNNLLGLGLPLGVGIAAIGSGIGLGRAVGSAMEAMGRQPEAIGQIQTAMVIGCAFIEALTIYALLAMFVLTVAAAEVAVGLAIIVALFRSRASVDVDEANSLKG